VLRAAYSYRAYADPDAIGHPYDLPYGNDFQPFPGTRYDDPIERTALPAPLVTLSSSALLPTGDPWLPDGAEETVGNNVDAFADLDAYKGDLGEYIIAPTNGLNPRLGDFRAKTTSPGVFDYPLPTSEDPRNAEAQNAAIVQVFYLTNWLHDDWYASGMTERAGNAQQSNYGRGGVSGDPVHAQIQDSASTDNATMQALPDGIAPTMQMYLFYETFNGALTIEEPVSIAGTYSNLKGSSFGPQEFNFSGEVVLIDDGSLGDGTGSTSDGCEPAINDIRGKIALIDRGLCALVDKVELADLAGAVGAIVINKFDGPPVWMYGSDPGIGIGSLMVTQSDGAALKSGLGAPEVASVERKLSIPIDGALDPSVVAHEYFHYVSTRLVNDSVGLLNGQGYALGEGWSDFAAMLLQVREEDRLVAGNAAYARPYSIATYASPDPYFGLRRAPYSTDFSVNPLTFRFIEDDVPLPLDVIFGYGQTGVINFAPHEAGEIWTLALWECYAALLNDGRFDFETARRRMQDYVIAALKITPRTPTYLEARDALLAVARATDNDDAVLFGAAFARRGMGLHAVAPDRWSTDGSGVIEDFTPID